MGGIIPGHTGQRRQIARKAVHILRIDGIALEGHSRGPDLIATKRLVPFANGGRLKQAQVEGEFVERHAEASQCIQDIPILTTGIGLMGDFKSIQAEQFHHALF